MSSGMASFRESVVRIRDFGLTPCLMQYALIRTGLSNSKPRKQYIQNLNKWSLVIIVNILLRFPGRAVNRPSIAIWFAEDKQSRERHALAVAFRHTGPSSGPLSFVFIVVSLF